MIYIVVAIALVMAYWLFSELFGYAKVAWEEWSKQDENSNEILEQRQIEIDDLKRLYGLGPESEKALRKAGINSFRELANTEVGQLEEIISEFSILVSPESWPAQADLAARDDWDEFEVLYENLRYQEIARRQVSNT